MLAASSGVLYLFPNRGVEILGIMSLDCAFGACIMLRMLIVDKTEYPIEIQRWQYLLGLDEYGVVLLLDENDVNAVGLVLLEVMDDVEAEDK